jgi:hypothetical protein
VSKKHDKEVEDAAQSNYELGQVVVYEGMEKDFRKRAGECFANSRDDHAKLLRRLADELKEEAVRMRKEYMEKWHPEVPK